MDQDLARTRLTTERADVERLLAETQDASAADQDLEQEPGDSGDQGQPLNSEGVEGAIAETLTDRLAAIDRAIARLDDGSYGVSIRSGDPIPDARLDADPAAELTIEEAQSDEAAAR
jgi:DnaK suppressor protein